MCTKTHVVSIVMLLILCLSLLPAGAQRMGGGGGGGGGMGGGGGSTVIDPPVSGVFKDPPQIVNVPGSVITLEVKITPINVNGTTANLMTYNGSYPGPTIRVKKGEKLLVDLKNSLPYTTQTNMLGYRKNITNLHTHGFHVSPEPPADYVMYELEPGQTYRHEYDLCMQPAGTLNLYHPHKHGVSAEQYWAGLMGAIVVEDETPALAAYETHIIVLKDITLSGNVPAPHSMMSDFMHGKEGNVIMVNGQVNPRLYTKAGQVQRWRIVNGSNARFYKLALQNHSLQLIGTDGGLLDKPYSQPYLILSPGERVDVLVQANQKAASYKLQALPYSRMGNMGGQTITLMTMTYSGKQSPAQTVPNVVNPAAVRVDPMSVMAMEREPLVLSMGQGNGYINGIDFDSNGMGYVRHSMLGSWEIWTVVNNSGMDHPFHQHVNPAQVLSVSGGDPGYAALYTSIPAWKDTVLVPKWGSIKMLVPVTDWPGMAMFHCHILEHEDIGMMGTWMIMGDPMPPM